MGKFIITILTALVVNISTASAAELTDVLYNASRIDAKVEINNIDSMLAHTVYVSKPSKVNISKCIDKADLSQNDAELTADIINDFNGNNKHLDSKFINGLKVTSIKIEYLKALGISNTILSCSLN